MDLMLDAAYSFEGYRCAVGRSYAEDSKNAPR